MKYILLALLLTSTSVWAQQQGQQGSGSDQTVAQDCSGRQSENREEGDQSSGSGNQPATGTGVSNQ